ncbi:gamma-butyrobetaine hydroxylase [Pholiota conissans]|uniref:Gamma-butyrobetaine hydroxylase n=1 Tax=Pholiota conissans TaxID=109636 RepID=A0A9P6CXH0_9AGAR|nr:gamma-butyrobetaine hydroxylase [Pholiota conissans]
MSAILRRHSRTAAAKALRSPTTFKRTWTHLTRDADALKISALGDTAFPYIWLRDACQSEACVHPSTRQKLFKTSDLPVDIAPAAGEEGVRLTAKGVDILWADGHQSSFSRKFLACHARPEALAEYHHDNHIGEEAWTRASISRMSDLFVDYEGLNTPKGLVDAITQLAKYGLLFVRGVPNKETASEKCELKALAERFGEIRPTFYGLLWDVVNLRDSKNIAYTNLDLGLHMDLLYFQHPPRYQILHCLRNQVVGGTSIFVDALHAAGVLRHTLPEDFAVLTQTPVSYHYVNDGHHLHREHPTIQLTPSGNDIAHINYSPPFQAPLPLSTPREFYPALRRFAELLNDEKNTYEYTLREGDAVLFDNRRVLHARTAFSERPGQEAGVDGEPNRWLKGCYLEADAVLDRMRVLRTKLEK